MQQEKFHLNDDLVLIVSLMINISSLIVTFLTSKRCQPCFRCPNAEANNFANFFDNWSKDKSSTGNNDFRYANTLFTSHVKWYLGKVSLDIETPLIKCLTKNWSPNFTRVPWKEAKKKNQLSFLLCIKHYNQDFRLQTSKKF